MDGRPFIAQVSMILHLQWCWYRACIIAPRQQSIVYPHSQTKWLNSSTWEYPCHLSWKGFGGADSHTNRFTLGCKQVGSWDEGKMTKLSANKGYHLPPHCKLRARALPWYPVHEDYEQERRQSTTLPESYTELEPTWLAENADTNLTPGVQGLDGSHKQLWSPIPLQFHPPNVSRTWSWAFPKSTNVDWIGLALAVWHCTKKKKNNIRSFVQHSRWVVD